MPSSLQVNYYYTIASQRVMLPVKTVEEIMLPVRKHQVVHFTLTVMISSHEFSLEGEVTLSKNMHKSLSNHKSLDWFIKVWKEQDRKIIRSETKRLGEVTPE